MASGRGRSPGGYTLVEVLIIVVVLSIAAAMVIPSMGSVDVLKVQAAVRTVVSDITFAQSDALAYQERRAIIFDVEENRYMILSVNGANLDPETDVLFDGTKRGQQYIVDFDDPEFNGAQLVSAKIDDDHILIYDELGGPVRDTTGDVPSAGGSITITGNGQTYTISIEAFTGRVTVAAGNGG